MGDVRKTCPKNGCRERLHFEQLHGMRLYREVSGRYVYQAKCPVHGHIELSTKRRPYGG